MTDKEKLLEGLKKQVELMISNAAYLHKLYPESCSHDGLHEAALAMQKMIDIIEAEVQNAKD